MRSPTGSKGAQTKGALLEAAATEFSARGFERATMTRIAKRAGVSIGTLYQYFANKPDILHALIATGLREVDELSVRRMERSNGGAAVRDNARQWITGAVQTFVNRCREYPRLRDVICHQSDADAGTGRVYRERQAKMIARVQVALDRWAPSDDNGMRARLIYAMVSGAVRMHIASPTVSDEQFASETADAILRVTLYSEYSLEASSSPAAPT